MALLASSDAGTGYNGVYMTLLAGTDRRSKSNVRRPAADRFQAVCLEKTSFAGASRSAGRQCFRVLAQDAGTQQVRLAFLAGADGRTEYSAKYHGRV